MSLSYVDCNHHHGTKVNQCLTCAISDAILKHVEDDPLMPYELRSSVLTVLMNLLIAQESSEDLPGCVSRIIDALRAFEEGALNEVAQ